MTKKTSEFRNCETEKLRKQNLSSVISMAIVAAGALSVGVCILLSEFLYPETEDFFACPVWYRIFMYVSLAITAGGIICCGFTKNPRNTLKAECVTELTLFLTGLFGMMIFALARSESHLFDVLICVGGAICSVGLFCGIGSLIGKMKKLGRPYAYLYSRLVMNGVFTYELLKRQKPATLKEIIKAEQFLGMPFPPELVRLFLEFNGDGDLIFSAETIAEKTKSIGKTENAFVLRFGNDQAGNYFCYKRSDGKNFDDEIYLLDRRTNDIYPVATKLSELIERYYNQKANKTNR